MQVEVDRNSGFCAGVIRAISNAEKFLDNEGGPLYSLGAIVHNEAELSRLGGKGLVTVGGDEVRDIRSGTILIRAHGQPPGVYEMLKERGLSIIDCTCPVVLKLQRDIKEAYGNMQRQSNPGQIIIFGKIGHAEVLGLVGQVGGDATVVENIEQLAGLLECGSVDPGKNLEIFSQTTMSPVEYSALCDFLKEKTGEGGSLTIHNTICSQVASRHEDLKSFARSRDIIIFVSGKTSSNGKVLCNLCKSVNERTYHIGDIRDLRREWFRPEDRVGVCGATSTPKWLLEQTAAAIENLQ